MVANFSNYLHVKWLPDDNNRKSTLSRQYYHFEVYSFTIPVITEQDQNFNITALRVSACNLLCVATSFFLTVHGFSEFQTLAANATCNLEHLRNTEYLVCKSPKGLIFSCNVYQKIQQRSAAKTNEWLFPENNSFQKHSRNITGAFPNQICQIHLLQGRDPLRVRAMFFKCACLDWSKGMDWAFSVAGPVC